jgi:hypothetical protein
VIAYLAGEDARPVTGTVLAVDAGRSTALWSSTFSYQRSQAVPWCPAGPGWAGGASGEAFRLGRCRVLAD